MLLKANEHVEDRSFSILGTQKSPVTSLLRRRCHLGDAPALRSGSGIESQSNTICFCAIFEGTKILRTLANHLVLVFLLVLSRRKLKPSGKVIESEWSQVFSQPSLFALSHPHPGHGSPQILATCLVVSSQVSLELR